jgi:iron(II)-dependent oxidoreductase
MDNQHSKTPDPIPLFSHESVVLFLGSDAPQGFPDAPPSRLELAHELARRGSLTPDDHLGAAARAFETRYGRQALNQQVIDLLNHPAYKPTRLHTQIAALPFQAILTTCQDTLLEQVLQAAGQPYATVLSDVETPYIDEQKVMVYKLLGCVTRPETLILTQKDQALLELRLPTFLKVLTYLFVTRPLLFLNYSLDDQFFVNLFHQVTASLQGHARRAYAAWPQATPDLVNQWQQDGLALMVEPASAVLDRLARQPRRQPAGQTEGPGRERLTRLPYKFLDFYTRQDVDIFYGRQIESVRFFRLALSHPVSVLFGASGTGKSSLLNAGVAPLLEKEQYSVLYVRALDEPLAAIRAEALDWRKRQGRQVTDPGPLPLRQFFRAILDPQEKLVVVLDQFEEFFLRLGDPLRQRFWLELAAFREPSGQSAETQQDGAEVRFVLSLREDYFHQMDGARRHLPDILSDSYRLTSLSEDKASTVITEPAARAGVTIEPALAVHLLADLGEAGAIAPPQLQIVCFRLFLDCLSNPDEALRGAPIILKRTHIRLADYQRLGEAKGILADYVRDELNRLADPAQRDLARALLKVLVTSEATKAAQNRAEIERGLAEAGALDAQDAMGLAQAHDVLCLLVERRLVREFERGGQALYELAHDHLAKEIHTWIDQAELQTKLARELLRREVRSWKSAGLLIGRDALAIIHERRDALCQIDEDTLKLLLRSSLAANYETPYWFERACQSGVDVNNIVLAGLKSENFRTRAAAVQALARLAQTSDVLQTSEVLETLYNRLTDLYPQVRVATIAALECLQPTGEWRKNLKYECYVPAGEFIMGDDLGNDNEKPAHIVYLDAYYIAKYPVTNAEYQRYRQDINQPFTMPTGTGDHPVVEVSWYDARDYASWAEMGLLSEAQWEKAASWDAEAEQHFARKRKYPWDDTFDKSKCNIFESGIGTTTPVGNYSKKDGDSPYGVADMVGNVWEWLNDWYLSSYYHKFSSKNPPGPKSGSFKVLRGGSWYSNENSAPCTSRYYYAPPSRTGYYGFRVGWQPGNH